MGKGFHVAAVILTDAPLWANGLLMEKVLSKMPVPCFDGAKSF